MLLIPKIPRRDFLAITTSLGGITLLCCPADQTMEFRIFLDDVFDVGHYDGRNDGALSCPGDTDLFSGGQKIGKTRNPGGLDQLIYNRISDRLDCL